MISLRTVGWSVLCCDVSRRHLSHVFAPFSDTNMSLIQMLLSRIVTICPTNIAMTAYASGCCPKNMLIDSFCLENIPLSKFQVWHWSEYSLFSINKFRQFVDQGYRRRFVSPVFRTFPLDLCVSFAELEKRSNCITFFHTNYFTISPDSQDR